MRPDYRDFKLACHGEPLCGHAGLFESSSGRNKYRARRTGEQHQRFFVVTHEGANVGRKAAATRAQGCHASSFDRTKPGSRQLGRPVDE